tara:strand:- start:1044 stop:1223 length:180 start_codon:yes stop_codon:yes gene_type:complete
MDKKNINRVVDYKYPVLDYTSWSNYVAETYEQLRVKNLQKKIKKQKAQIKENVIQFCTR